MCVAPNRPQSLFCIPFVACSGLWWTHWTVHCRIAGSASSVLCPSSCTWLRSRAARRSSPSPPAHGFPITTRSGNKEGKRFINAIVALPSRYDAGIVGIVVLFSLLQGRYFQTPLSYEPLEYASSFSSEDISEAIVAVTGSSMRIITIQNFGQMFNQSEYPLSFTPRQMVQVRSETKAGHVGWIGSCWRHIGWSRCPVQRG